MVQAGHFELGDGPLTAFMAKTAAMSTTERGFELNKAKDLQEMSDETAASGETEGAGTNDAMNSHFISFVAFEGQLYELDGRCMDESGTAFPIAHGTSPVCPASLGRALREQLGSRRGWRVAVCSLRNARGAQAPPQPRVGCRMLPR